MKNQTHWNIARLSVCITEETFPEYKIDGFKKIMFYLGTIKPDFSIIQFVHPHFYEKSAEYAYSKLKKINQKEGRKGLLDFYKLGKSVHFLCDFCCHAHIDGGIGNPVDHIVYEHGINRYLIDNYNKYHQMTSQEKTKLPPLDDLILYIDVCIKEYKLARPSYSLDIRKSIEIAVALLSNVLLDIKSIPHEYEVLELEIVKAS